MGKARNGGEIVGTITEQNIATLVSTLYETRQQKAALEKTEKTVLEQLKPLVDPEFDMHLDLGLPVSETVIRVGVLDLSRVSGTSRTIVADKLLERGVAPDVVAFATKTTAYFQYRVREVKS